MSATEYTTAARIKRGMTFQDLGGTTFLATSDARKSFHAEEVTIVARRVKRKGAVHAASYLHFHPQCDVAVIA